MSITTKIILTSVGIMLLVSAGAIVFAGKPPKPPEVKPPAAEAKRDRFNDPLPAKAVARMGTVGFRHRGWSSRLEFTPDGKHLVSSGLGWVHVWDAKSGREVAARGGAYPVDDEMLSASAVVNAGNTKDRCR